MTDSTITLTLNETEAAALLDAVAAYYPPGDDGSTRYLLTSAVEHAVGKAFPDLARQDSGAETWLYD